MKPSKQSLALYALIIALSVFTVSCFDNPSGSDEKSDENGTYSHVQNPGISANDFLSEDKYSSLIIEIDYMQGFAPNDEALDSLQAFLERRLNKVSITIQTSTEIPAAGQASYTASEIRSLEDQHRDEFTEGSTLAAYMLTVDSQYENGNVLGIAYYNTSTAFFGGTYDEVSGGLNEPSRRLTESISFRHEFGHLLGLVNIPNSGTEMQTNHQDSEHGRHCDNDSCLMYYAMERAGLFGQFFGENIPSLDDNCIADLKGNGGK
jgi:predicted Zn-dependent protease